MHSHQLSTVHSALDSGTAQPAQVVVALNKVFESGSTPEELVDYALLALNAPAPELRQLAASQLGRTVQVGPTLRIKTQHDGMLISQINSATGSRNTLPSDL